MIRINVKGLNEAIEYLRGMRRRLGDLRPAWQAILLYLREATREQFRTEGARNGSPWQALSPAYARWKTRRYPGQPILRASDEMFRSLVGQTGESVIRIEPRRLEYGTRRRYGRYHQRGEGYNPLRQFLDVTEEDRRQIKKLARLHLENQSILSGFERKS